MVLWLETTSRFREAATLRKSTLRLHNLITRFTSVSDRPTLPRQLSASLEDTTKEDFPEFKCVFYFLESIIVVATKANLCAASSRWLSSPGAGSNMVTTKSRDIWKSVTQGDKVTRRTMDHI